MKAPVRILIVEDNGLIATAIKKILLKAGYEVIAVVPSGELAVQKAEADPLDLVLMDIRLRGAIDGIEAATQIRAQHDIPIIYLTGHSTTELIERAKATEPFRWIRRPQTGRPRNTPT